jgi:hypothetical protein
MSSSIDINAIIAAVAQNSELAQQFAALIAEQQPRARADHAAELPSIDRITAIQATHFDNGPKKGTVRHKLTLEVWTDPAETLNVRRYQHKKTASLVEYWAFRDRIKSLVQHGSITQQHHDEVNAILEDAKPLLDRDELLIMCGLIGSKQGGTRYFDRQWVFTVMQKKTLQMTAAQVYLNNKGIDFEGFVSTDCKGNALKSPAMSQSRADRCSFSSRWDTTQVDI